MIALIAIRRDGDRSTRGTIAGRSPLLAAQHLIRRSVALPHDLRFVVSSGVGCRRGGPFDNRNLEICKPDSQKFSPVLKAAGSLIPGLRRALQLLQKPAHRVRQQFHFGVLSSAAFDVSNMASKGKQHAHQIRAIGASSYE